MMDDFMLLENHFKKYHVIDSLAMGVMEFTREVLCFVTPLLSYILGSKNTVRHFTVLKDNITLTYVLFLVAVRDLYPFKSKTRVFAPMELVTEVVRLET
jgi:hypothetical protein